MERSIKTMSYLLVAPEPPTTKSLVGAESVLQQYSCLSWSGPGWHHPPDSLPLAAPQSAWWGEFSPLNLNGHIPAAPWCDWEHLLSHSTGSTLLVRHLASEQRTLVLAGSARSSLWDHRRSRDWTQASLLLEDPLQEAGKTIPGFSHLWAVKVFLLLTKMTS